MGIETLLAGLPGTAAQGIIYGIMALGIFITFKFVPFFMNFITRFIY